MGGIHRCGRLGRLRLRRFGRLGLRRLGRLRRIAGLAGMIRFHGVIGFPGMVGPYRFTLGIVLFLFDLVKTVADIGQLDDRPVGCKDHASGYQESWEQRRRAEFLFH
jgi:hypothetical protein